MSSRVAIATLLLISSTTLALGHARRIGQIRSVLVGAIVCRRCFHQPPSSKTNHALGGVLVLIECRGDEATPMLREEVKTNIHGAFSIPLPVEVGEHMRRIKSCSVKIIRSKRPLLVVASSSSSALQFKGKKGQTHLYSTGLLDFRNLDQVGPHNLKRDLTMTTNVIGSMKFPFPPSPFQPPSLFPPNPFAPPPSILPPNPFSPPSPSIFPPNPFQPPPPTIFPPNPFFRSPPPPPPFFSFPPIPGLTPPSPPPPFFHLPPLPFPNFNPPSPPPPSFHFPPFPSFNPPSPPSFHLPPFPFPSFNPPLPPPPPPPPPPRFHLPPFPFIPSPFSPGNPPPPPPPLNSKARLGV